MNIISFSECVLCGVVFRKYQEIIPVLPAKSVCVFLGVGGFVYLSSVGERCKDV